MAVYYMIDRLYRRKPIPHDPVLDNNSWATIQRAAQEGVASDYWSVGDRKEITLNGTVGTKTFSNQTVYAYILGFNHNASKEGNNTIHFQLAFDALTSGNHIAFCDSNYSSSSGTFRMNTSGTNSGGWSNSYMRNTVVPAFISAMPSDLQAVLKVANKYTDNGTGSAHTSSSDVTATSDKVFLLSEFEVLGARSYANSYEQNYQLQYDYYKNGNSIVMYNDTSISNEVIWWTRSPYSSSFFAEIDTRSTGSVGINTAGTSYGFAPGFVVG